MDTVLPANETLYRQRVQHLVGEHDAAMCIRHPIQPADSFGESGKFLVQQALLTLAQVGRDFHDPVLHRQRVEFVQGAQYFQREPAAPCAELEQRSAGNTPQHTRGLPRDDAAEQR
jgi:hypothetical protein